MVLSLVAEEWWHHVHPQTHTLRYRFSKWGPRITKGWNNRCSGARQVAKTSRN